MKKLKIFKFLLLLIVVLTFLSMKPTNEEKPVMYIIGDSTVKNGKGDGAGGLWGWGDFIHLFFDTTKIKIENHAIGGRSSRTFQEEGRWDKILNILKPGDYVLIQFGHNDGGSLNTGRARGTLQGVGNDSIDVVMESDNSHHIIRTYGWYIEKYIMDAKSKGAIPIVLSYIPRNQWEKNKVKIGTYVEWAKEAASEENAFFINLNEIVRDYYENIGKDIVNLIFFKKDHTHTTEAGAKLNAYAVAQGIKTSNDCYLKKYLLPKEVKK